MGVLLAIPIVFMLAVIFVVINMVSGGDKGQSPQSWDRRGRHFEGSQDTSNKPLKGLLSYRKPIVE